MDNNYHGESFLNRLYKDLHMSDEVMHTAIPSDTKDEKVSKYLDRLEKIEELAKNSRYNGLDLLKKLFYKKYIIKPENVPESYFELQKRIALERGFGYVNVSSKEKKQMIDAIISDQKKSLDVWLDYLISNDSLYPEWFKYYAFQGMLKLGSYDKAKASFNKRTNSTTNVFIDLNSEALALVYDNLCYSLEGNKVDDLLLQKLLDSGSFSKLYAYMLRTIDNSNKDIHSNDGIWVKYNQGSSPDELVKSLAGKGTGWCTAGIETARTQLQGGDFYVYYTKDSNNEYKQPRIAIRMEGSSIGEIRGIASNQNLEPEMEEVVDKKLDEFPDKDKYKKKVNDMKILTEIYNNYKNRDLTVEELRFLYEIDNKIDGFGYQIDPRIEEILKDRNFKTDLSRVFNCSEDEISNDKNDVFEGKKIVYFVGDLDLSELTTAKGLVLPINIGGSLYLTKLKSAEGLVLPDNIGGSLDLISLKSIEGLTLPNNIGESLGLSSLTSAKGLVLPNNIGESLYLNRLTSAEGLVLPNNMDGSLFLNSLSSTKGLILPNDISGSLHLENLISAKGLILPNNIGGGLDLSSLTSAKGLTLPNNIGTALLLNGLTSAKGLVLPNNIGESLYLNNLTDAEDLVLPNNISYSLYLKGLTSAKGLTLPNNMDGSLYLNSLTNAEGLTLPNNIGGLLNLEDLTSAKGLILPNNIGESLFLNSLTSAENLILPNDIKVTLNLSNLESAVNVVLPRNIGSYLFLNKLTTTDGLVVPTDFNCKCVWSSYISIDDLKAKSLEINKENFKQKGFSKVGILILLNIIVSIGLIFLGVLFSL